MLLKSVVDELLKEKNRPMSWLAAELGKTFDGLKLSLMRGSIKYTDIIAMAKVLEVSSSVFFPDGQAQNTDIKNTNFIGEDKTERSKIKYDLKNCREMVAALKVQIKDKDKIISLLSKER